MKKILEKVYQDRKQAFFQELSESLIHGEKRFIVTANPEIIMASLDSVRIAAMLLDERTEIIADGIGVVKACHRIGKRSVEKIAGVDVVAHLLEEANRCRKKLMVLGCTQEVPDRFARQIEKHYPQIIVTKLINGYVADKEAALLENRKEQADIVLAALGVPAQELLLYQYLDQFSSGIFIGVGGSIDVLSGTKRRAPDFFVDHGMEWLYRIGKEPKRMKRFLKNNIRFVREVKRLK